MNKKDIIQQVLQHLLQELDTTQLAAKNAHLAAIDDQSIAETQYDTVAIEAGYLAEGQSRRVEEIQKSVTLFKQLNAKELQTSPVVKTGSLVQLEKGCKNSQWYFIAPAAGGFTCKIIDTHNNVQNIVVITPYSPMGKALVTKQVDDEVIILVNGESPPENIDYIETIT